VKQHFTHFSPEGVPLRATLTLSFREYKRLSEQMHQLNLESADQTSVHVFEQGETLSSVAAREYHDPRAWRHIAASNEIDDPLAVPPGALLAVPPIL
jgi:nucleoid-associated protein YgaU